MTTVPMWGIFTCCLSFESICIQTVGADHTAGVQDHAAANRDALANDCVGKNLAIRADGHVVAHKRPGVQHRVCADLRALANVNKRPTRQPSASIAVAKRALRDRPLRAGRGLCREELKRLDQRQVRIIDDHQ